MEINLLETVTPRHLNRLLLACLSQARHEAKPGASADAVLACTRRRTLEVLDSRQMCREARLATVLMTD
jgi:hypothetical protein